MIFPQQQDLYSKWKGLITPSEPITQPEPTQEEDEKQGDFYSRWKSKIPEQEVEPPIQMPPAEPTWEDVLRPITEHAEKLVTGKLGVKIGGKTPTEHVGQFLQPVGEEIVGLGEGAIAGASEYAAFIPSLIAGIGANAVGKSFVESVAIHDKVSRFLSHEPNTKKGEIYRRVVTAPLALFGLGLEKVTEGMDAETEAAVKLGSGVVLVAAGGYLHGSAKAAVNQAVKTGKSFKQAKNIIKKAREVPPEIKAVVEKIPDLPPEKVTVKATVEKAEGKWSPDRKPTPEQIAEQKAIREEAKVLTVEQNIQRMKELEKPKLEKPTKPKEFYAGYNLLEELKQSIRYLKGEKPEITPKKLGKKDVSLEPSRTPKAKIPPEELPMPSAGQQIYDALVEAKPLRKEQEAMFTKERGRKMEIGIEKAGELRGRARAEAFRKAQAGEMKKLDFEPPKVSNKVAEEMYDQIWDSPAITPWERLSANDGLTTLLEGRIPQEGQIILLDRVFPKSLTQALMKKRTTWKKIKHGVFETSGIPRAVMAAWDFSGGFRQGIFLAARYPKQFGNAFMKQFKQFGSEKAFKAAYDSITKRDTYSLMRKGELALTEMDSALKLREEPFMSHWADKVPLVRRSGRAYSGLLNLLRADVFDLLVKNAEKLGYDIWKDTKLIEDIGHFVNVGSGRGSLKRVLGINLEKSAVLMNQIFFSPRLLSSRLKLLNPAFYVKLHPFVRKQALQSLLAFASAGTAIMTLVKMGGGEVETNPTSSDFGKIKIGNTRIDIWGGFQQYIRTGAQLAVGQTKSTRTGETTELKGMRLLPYPKLQKGKKQPGAPSQATIIGRWASYKQAPVLSFFTDLLKGTGAGYEDLDFTKGFDDPLELSDNPVAQRFIPMVMQDLMDIAKDDPDIFPLPGLGLFMMGVFGVGLQTYEPKGQKKKSLGR